MASYFTMMQQAFSSIANNATAPALTNETMASSVPNISSGSISSFIALLYSYSALRDWLKLIVMGGIFESFRRIIMGSYSKFIDSFYIRASFDSGDPSYQWILVWLSKQPSWSKTRDMHITTRVGSNSPAVVLEGEDNNSGFFKSSRKIGYLPTASLTYSLWYKRRWMTIKREQRETGLYGDKENTLHISIFTRNHNTLTDLLQEARRFYMAGQEHSMCVYVSDSSNRWNHVACRARRPISSIVLDPGVSDVILEDARDFLRSKPWYAERGIPFRRGYLLYGSPGSGKTSLIHCMAGELMLDVYIISLSRAGLDDASLSELVNALPERCLALMEDIDAAFTHGVTRNLDEENNDPKKANAPPPPAGSASTPTPSRLSLSGLLNALDGVGAQEGRILFATTNRYSALDEALCRPGRMDLHIEFKDASKYQARELFKRFYLPTPAADSTKKEQTPEEIEDDCSQLVNDKSLEDKTPPVDLSIFKGQKHTNRAPVLSRVRIDELAQRFADSIPDREHSMASLQGFLMSYKTRPVEAVDGVDAWLEKEKKRKQEKEKEKTEMKKKETEKSKEDGLKNSDNEKEEIKQTGKESEKTASVPDPLRCNCSPVCSVCGGVKPAAEEVVLGLPSPISKPATPVEGSTQESLTLENAILSLPAGA